MRKVLSPLLRSRLGEKCVSGDASPHRLIPEHSGCYCFLASHVMLDAPPKPPPGISTVNLISVGLTIFPL